MEAPPPPPPLYHKKKKFPLFEIKMFQLPSFIIFLKFTRSPRVEGGACYENQLGFMRDDSGLNISVRLEVEMAKT